MAQDLQVKCIRKTNRTEPHARIQGIGGTQADSSRWYLEEAKAIQGIKNGTWTFHTYVGGVRARVIIAKRLGVEYLKTERDGETPDNLLALPECP